MHVHVMSFILPTPVPAPAPVPAPTLVTAPASMPAPCQAPLAGPVLVPTPTPVPVPALVPNTVRFTGSAAKYYDSHHLSTWKLPMFGCTAANKVPHEAAECNKAYPQCYVRLAGLDSMKQVQVMSSLTSAPMPALAPVPTLVPSQVPAPVPAPVRAPIQAPVVVPVPGLAPVPTPVPVLAPAPAPTPVPVPAPVPDPAATPAPEGAGGHGLAPPLSLGTAGISLASRRCMAQLTPATPLWGHVLWATLGTHPRDIPATPGQLIDNVASWYDSQHNN